VRVLVAEGWVEGWPGSRLDWGGGAFEVLVLVVEGRGGGGRLGVRELRRSDLRGSTTFGVVAGERRTECDGRYWRAREDDHDAFGYGSALFGTGDFWKLESVPVRTGTTS